MRSKIILLGGGGSSAASAPVTGTTGTTNVVVKGETLYFATFVNGVTTTLTLPVGAALGDTFAVWINGANGAATLTTSATVYRAGDSASGNTLTPNQVAAANAKHKLVFTFDGTNWWYNDTFSAALNLAGSGTVSGLLPAANGGTGISTSASTGIPQIAAGTWTVSTTLPSGLSIPSPTVTGTLTANTGTNLFGPFVDSVDGVTPLNNMLQTVAAGTAYTMTASYADIVFGTTSPILTLANAGTYWLSADIQFSLVGATYATYQSATVKLRRTNNTPADVAGSTFGTFIPTITTITALGPLVHIGPIKYTTALTTDTLTVDAILSALPSAGSVTVTNCTIAGGRLY